MRPELLGFVVLYEINLYFVVFVAVDVAVATQYEIDFFFRSLQSV